MTEKKKKNQTKKEKKSEEVVEVRTEIKYLPISPRKLRLVVEAVKTLTPREALRKLAFLNKKGARLLIKAIKSALANAENNFGLARESLELSEMLVNEGPRLKRRDKSHGARFDGGIIQKRRSHLVIKVRGRRSGPKS